MDISFAYFGVRLKEICTRSHAGPVGPTPVHMETCCHTGVNDGHIIDLRKPNSDQSGASTQI
jgi:hypothetical protein